MYLQGEESLMIKFGVLLAREDETFNMDSFENLEALRVFLNKEYDINIVRGMTWDTVVKELEAGIETKRYNKSMDIL